jgi:hypothetical protein
MNMEWGVYGLKDSVILKAVLAHDSRNFQQNVVLLHETKRAVYTLSSN